MLRIPLAALTLSITLSLSHSLSSSLSPLLSSIPPPGYSPSCAHIFSFLVHPSPATRTTLSTLRHPHRVIIVYARNTGKRRKALCDPTILRPDFAGIIRVPFFLSHESRRQDLGPPHMGMGFLIDVISYTVILIVEITNAELRS